MSYEKNFWDPALSEKHQKILETALETFAAQGYSGTTTNEIASKAGVSQALIFKHYKTKKDLFLGVVAPLFLRVMGPTVLGEFRRVLAGPYDDAAAFVAAVVKDRLAFVRRHNRFVRVAMQEFPFHDELRTQVQAIATREIGPAFLNTIGDLRARGKLIDVPPHIILRTIISQVAAYVFHRYVYAPHDQWDEDAEERHIIALITNALTPR